MREFTDNNFVEEVENYDGIAVVDFWASWCGPCKMLAPIFEELDSELGDKIKFGKVNVDDNPSISNKYKIASIPTLLVFKNGNVVDTLVGFRPKQELKVVIEKYV
ncbi:MAG: thioredoxin [Clostridiales bacterium]|uniref:thioredoxin n=1 Tax=Clostridium sp. N3C TaxID=1776758 RepID=UPI00092E0DF3|nr:thioredoxin [Clostridium sp. N3C]NLZ49884.1 thioredoxin [Clostridiales bacterium]SCN24162.1 Thioredoxin [Clostridium sp. N3C]